ncbi:MAG: FHA domain-containing protein [Oligoflexia bacterium]|nr:FHA domain-containing protein [Oligoflexia bacterium]
MGAAPVLDILRDGERIRSCPIEGEIVLGRSEGCVIRLDDRAISRQHAVFRAVAGGVQVEKRSEFAPMMVNGSEVTSAVLKDGDVISIGPYLLRLAAEKAQEETFDKQQSAGALAEVAPGLTESVASPPLPPVDLAAETGPVEQTPPEELPVAGLALSDNEEAPAVPGLADGPEPDFPAPRLGDLTGPVSAGTGSTPEMIDDDARTKMVASEKVNVRLVFKEGDANVTELELTQDEVSIGRGKTCDIVLNDKKSSRKNAVIRRAGLNFVIKDLGSANGTYVNGVRVEEQELVGDDLIQIGDVQFQFKAMSADYQAKEANFLKVVEDEAPPVEELPFPEAQDANRGSAVLEMPPAPADLGPSGNDYIAGAPTGLIPPGAPEGIPGMTGIPGMGGVVGASTAAPKSITGKLLAKYRAMPKRQQFVWTIILICLAAFLIFEEEDFMDVKPKQRQVQKKGDKAGGATFESLTPEQRKFIESQHVLAFDFYKARDYDKALFELDKIFALVPDYKDSREIERYAREGKRKLEAMQEEKRRKEEEARLKAKVAQLEEEGRKLMSRQQFDQLQEIMAQILAHDPENAAVGEWRQELEKREEARRAEEQRKAVQGEINREAWRVHRAGVAFFKKGKFKSAIGSFQHVREIGATDRRLERQNTRMLRAAQSALKSVRDPLLAEARQLETSGEFVKAFELYQKATRIDPSHAEGYRGMDRIRGILHDRARHLYAEAVLAESYSDFETARAKFEECRNTAPPEDIYRERAERKLARYLNREGTPQ